MKLFFSLALAATLFTAGAAQAQTKVKTKTKSDNGTEIKSKGEATPVTLDGPIKRVETLSGIDIYPKPNSNSVLLSFTQQFTKPGTLTMTDYKDKVSVPAGPGPGYQHRCPGRFRPHPGRHVPD